MLGPGIWNQLHRHRGWCPPLPPCTLRGAPRGLWMKKGVQINLNVTWRPSGSVHQAVAGSSTSCSPSCLAFRPTKTTFRGTVCSALDVDQGVCSPVLNCPPLCWQFNVEMLLSDAPQKSDCFFRVRVETENSLGECLFSFEITPVSFSAAPLFLTVLLGSSLGS